MAKVSQHFTITKHLINNVSIVFEGIVYNNNPTSYDIEDVRFHTKDIRGTEIVEEITQWFHSFRQLNDPQFYHEDICKLLVDFLSTNKKHYSNTHLKDAA